MTVDRVLEVLDAGLQASSEAGYGTDWNPDSCARCQRHAPTDGGDICGGCRAFLLEDTDDDPRHEKARDYALFIPLEEIDLFIDNLNRQAERPLTAEDVAAMLAVYGIAAERAMRLFEDLVRTFGEVFRSMVDAIAQILRDPIVAALIEDIADPPQPATAARHTLNRWAPAPARDLRATQAPRRPPMLYRRTP